MAAPSSYFLSVYDRYLLSSVMRLSSDAYNGGNG